jgi:hypothetical protein
LFLQTKQLPGLTEKKLDERDAKLREEFRKRGSKDSVASDPAQITDELRDQMKSTEGVRHSGMDCCLRRLFLIVFPLH